LAASERHDESEQRDECGRLVVSRHAFLQRLGGASFAFCNEYKQLRGNMFRLHGVPALAYFRRLSFSEPCR
jgi:hypothetical protein